VPGPIDIIQEGSTGALDEDLAAAVYRALRLDGEACIEFAQYHSWQRSAERFLKFQHAPVDAPRWPSNALSTVSSDPRVGQ
jgi:hypothetical protein